MKMWERLHADHSSATVIEHDDGTYEATLVVVDAAGVPSLPVTAPVVVANAAPVVSIGSITTGTPGANTVASLSASFTDLGLSDQHTATIDWGDGSAPEPGSGE